MERYGWKSRKAEVELVNTLCHVGDRRKPLHATHRCTTVADKLCSAFTMKADMPENLVDNSHQLLHITRLSKSFTP